MPWLHYYYFLQLKNMILPLDNSSWRGWRMLQCCVADLTLQRPLYVKAESTARVLTVGISETFLGNWLKTGHWTKQAFGLTQPVTTEVRQKGKLSAVASTAATLSNHPNVLWGPECGGGKRGETLQLLLLINALLLSLHHAGYSKAANCTFTRATTICFER